MTDSAHSPAKAKGRKAAPATQTGQVADHAMPAVVEKTLGGLSAEGLRQFFARETARYTTQRAETRAALRAEADHFMGGVPMAWMRDWPLPYPLVVARAEEARLTDLDGYEIDDFCLGDGVAPFGHTPEPVVKAIRKQAERGISYLLPSAKALDAGAALSEVYGDYRWQLALSASDANRNAIKIARAVTRRAKVLVFNGSYHGTVDDVMVRADRGRTKQRRGLVGQVHDLRLGAVAVEFNDLAAVEAALATGEIAAILTEPVMTRRGIVHPAEGFLSGLRDLARQHDALLIFDESHTHLVALGGYARMAGVTPDILVIGKGVAGGMPTAVYGLSDEVAGRFAAYDALRAEGHSGMGTSLAGNAMQAAALVAVLRDVATPKAFAKIDRNVTRLATGLQEIITRFALPWQVVRLGGRVGMVCTAQELVNGSAAEAATMPAVERALHIGLLNRGALMSPHQMMFLVTPVTGKVQISRLLVAIEDVLCALAGIPAPALEPVTEHEPAAQQPAPIEAASATPAIAQKVIGNKPEPSAQNQPQRKGWWQKPAVIVPPVAPQSAAPVAAPVPAVAPVKAVPAEPVEQPVAQAAPRRAGWWQKTTVAAPAPQAQAPAAPVKVQAVVQPAPAAVQAPTSPRKGWWQAKAPQATPAPQDATPPAAAAKAVNKAAKAEKPVKKAASGKAAAATASAPETGKTNPAKPKAAKAQDSAAPVETPADAAKSAPRAGWWARSPR